MIHMTALTLITPASGIYSSVFEALCSFLITARWYTLCARVNKKTSPKYEFFPLKVLLHSHGQATSLLNLNKGTPITKMFRCFELVLSVSGNHGMKKFSITYPIFKQGAIAQSIKRKVTAFRRRRDLSR